MLLCAEFHLKMLEWPQGSAAGSVSEGIVMWWTRFLRSFERGAFYTCGDCDRVGTGQSSGEGSSPRSRVLCCTPRRGSLGSRSS